MRVESSSQNITNLKWMEGGGASNGLPVNIREYKTPMQFSVIPNSHGDWIICPFYWDLKKRLFLPMITSIL